MSRKFAAGNRALAICDRCGFTFKLHELRPLTVNMVQTNTKVCESCWEPDHPQNMQGRYPIDDPQALRDPRPDTAELEAVRAMTVPVNGFGARAKLEGVSVTT